MGAEEGEESKTEASFEIMDKEMVPTFRMFLLGKGRRKAGLMPVPPEKTGRKRQASRACSQRRFPGSSMSAGSCSDHSVIVMRLGGNDDRPEPQKGAQDLGEDPIDREAKVFLSLRAKVTNIVGLMV